MVLLRLMRIQIMSKNKENEYNQTITLTDPDTGATLSIPEGNVNNWDDDYITITSDDAKTITLSDYVDNEFIRYSDLTTIYERPNEKTIRKKYTGHKKIDDISDIGIHTLEKMSKRGDK